MARDRAARPEAKPLRLFVAVDLPEAARRELGRAIAPWRERYPKGRWVPEGNWHVTVKFLGRTWPRLLDWVIERVDGVASHRGAFHTSLRELGSFPSARRARVLWAGLEDPKGRFRDLAGSLDQELAREFEPESRSFTPHLTVARFDPAAALEGLEEARIGGGSFRVDRLVLYRSHLGRPAPRYEPLGEFALGE